MSADSELVDWLRRKVAEAEKALKTREEMQATWHSGTNAEWRAAAVMYPSTAGHRLSKATRLKQAATHGRIAVKLRHEVKMFNLALDRLAEPAQQASQEAGP